MSKHQARYRFFNRLSISAKIAAGVLSCGILAVIATTYMVGRTVEATLLDQFHDANTEITKLIASNAAGAIRWKKKKAVEDTFTNVTDDPEHPVLAVIAVNADGTLVGSFETKQVPADALLQAAKGKTSLQVGESAVLADTHAAFTVVAAAGKNKKGEPHGYLAIAWPTDALHAEVAEKRRDTVLTLSAVFIVMAICIVLLMRSMVSRPLTLVSKRITALANGDTESAVAFLDRGDEIGHIASSLADLTKREVERLTLQANQETETTKQAERQQRIETLTNTFQSRIAELVGTVDEQMDKMRNTAVSLSGVASATTEQTKNVSHSSDQASRNVQTISSSAEELSASIREIGDQIQRTTSVVQSADEQARASATKMNRLAEASEKIGAVVDLIRDIAEQTNLLALNATIESARAGEAGKGFAVVASEVKTLANQTAQATDEIAMQISQIQGATQEAESEIKGIVDIMSEASQLSAAIATAVSQQSMATEEIGKNIDGAAQSARQVVDAIGLVAQSATDAENASNEVDIVSKDVDTQISSLRDEVSKFSSGIAAA